MMMPVLSKACFPVGFSLALYIGFSMYWHAWQLVNTPCVSSESIGYHLINLISQQPAQLCAMQRQMGEAQLGMIRHGIASASLLLFSYLQTTFPSLSKLVSQTKKGHEQDEQ
jgi:hypothetical protein